MLGVRYTTARHTAERAVDLVVGQLARTVNPCRTADVPLVGGEMPDFDAFLRDETRGMSGPVPLSTRERLVRTHGTRYRVVLRKLAASVEDRALLGPGCLVTAGEVRHAVREEMAVRLSDALLRRTEAGSAGYPGDDAVAAAANVMAAELDWTPQRIEAEVNELRRMYQLPG